MTVPTEPLTPVGWDDVTDEDFVEALLNCQEQLKQARDAAAELRAAVKVWAKAFTAESTTSAAANEESSQERFEAWQEAERQLEEAEQTLHALAATEGSEPSA